MYRAQRSSSNDAKDQLQQGTKEQQKGADRSSFYSATTRFVIVFLRRIVLEPSVHFIKTGGMFRTTEKVVSFSFRFVKTVR